MQLETLKALAGHAGGQFLPILGALHIYETATGNRAQVGNGRYTVDVPTTLPPMTVSATRLAAAAAACGKMPDLTVGASQVTVKAGRVRARINLDPTPYPLATPDPGNTVAIPGVGKVLETLARFAATDASRPWATAICLSGDHAYATNNVVVARHPLAAPVAQPVNVPMNAIDAVVQRGDVVNVGLTENSVTFYYADESWVRTQLIAGTWPTGVVDNYVDKLDDGVWETVNQSLVDMLQTASRMSDDRNPVVEFNGFGLALVDNSFEADELEPVPDTGRVSAKMAALVFGVADRVQWHTPKLDTHAFRAGELVGVIGGTK